MTRRTVTAARSATLEAAPVVHRVGRAVAADAAPLTLDVCVVPWGVPARVTDDGRTHYTETWGRGSLTPLEVVPVYSPHTPGRLERDGRRAIGRAHDFRDESTGLFATVTLIPSAGDYVDLARLFGSIDVSLEADVPAGASGVVARSAASPCPLTGLSLIPPPGRGAVPGAVAAARADADPPDDPPEDPDDPDDPDPTTPTGRAALAELVRAEVARSVTGRRRGGTAVTHPLARFANAAAMVTAARSGTAAEAAELSAAFTASYLWHREVEAMAQTAAGRAWVDEVTTENPGVVPPAWLTRVFGIIDRGRPSINVLGGSMNPGPSGMEVNWPFYDGDLTALVAQQLTEKTAINSVKVSFKKGSADLLTYAGGSDVSFQLARRSSPSYMALYDRTLQIGYGLTTENAFIDAVVAGATGAAVPWDLAADDDGAATRAAFFAASLAVRNATGIPATAVLVASDVFAALGGKAWLLPPQYGTQNVTGTAAASSLRINISGLEVTESPFMAAGKAVATNQEATGWFEVGPYLATADDVQKLGTDVAIWGMGAAGLFLPNGVVPFTVTLPPVVPLATSRSAK